MAQEEWYLTRASCVRVQFGVRDTTCYLKCLCLHRSPANKLFSASLPCKWKSASPVAMKDHLPAWRLPPAFPFSHCNIGVTVISRACVSCSGGKAFFMNVCAAPAAVTYLTHMRNWILFLIAAGVRAGPLYHLAIPWDAAQAAATAALALSIYIFGMEHKSSCSGRSKMEIYFFFQLCLFPSANITMEGSWGSRLKQQNTDLLKKMNCSRIWSWGCKA